MFTNSPSNSASDPAATSASHFHLNSSSRNSPGVCFEEKPRLSNQQLMEALTLQVRKERELTASIIELIREVSARRLYLEFGFTSMFEFLVKQMGYSEGAAQRRWDAAKMLTQIPELRRDLEEGSVNLSQIAVLAQGVRQAEKEQGQKVSTETKREVLEKLRDQTLQESKLTVAQALDISIQDKERQRVQKDESVRCEFTLTKEEMAEVEKAKELLSHILPGASLKDVFLRAVRELNERRDPARSVRRKSSAPKGAEPVDETAKKAEPVKTAENLTATAAAGAAAQTTAAAGAATQVITAAKADAQETAAVGTSGSMTKISAQTKPATKSVARSMRAEVFARDQHCQWQDPRSGQTCTSRHQLQIDHIQPQWADGEHTVDNLQILCGVHNRLKYHREAGLGFKGF